MLKKALAGVAEQGSELRPRVRPTHIDDANGLDAQPRRLGIDEVGRFARLDAAPELLFRRDQNRQIEGVHGDRDHPFAAAGTKETKAPVFVDPADRTRDDGKTMAAKAKVPAIAYLRTSSAANVGADKNSGRRQREAIQAFARRAGYKLVAEFYDAAVSGADPHRRAPWLRRHAQSDQGQRRADDHR
jgi:hypothetical protein